MAVGINSCKEINIIAPAAMALNIEPSALKLPIKIIPSIVPNVVESVEKKADL